MSDSDAYLLKSVDAARMGKAAEYLVASVCILATRGRLNVSTALVDDEGVDLVFHLRDESATLAVQVKARMADGTSAARGRFQALVRSQTFRPRPDLDMLFVLIDNRKGSIHTAWLVPSPEFAEKCGSATARGHLRFAAAVNPNSCDKWTVYRLLGPDLPGRVVGRLGQHIP